MKVLVTGKGGRAGSWVVRGEQLGAAMGAAVVPMATRADMRGSDAVVVVKRTPDAVIDAVRAAGLPWAFDLVDCYPQPLASNWERKQAISWVREKLAALRPTGVIWPTQRMQHDCDTGWRGIVLPHHHRPGIATNQVRDKVEAIGYEGAPHYLGEWEAALQKQCRRRGWRFVVNPAQLSELDIVVAARGGAWAGYVQQHWKSNVKLANAHGSGTPFAGQRECGYIETGTGAEYFFGDQTQLSMCLDWLTPAAGRRAIAQRFKAAAYSVDDAARALLGFLRGL